MDLAWWQIVLGIIVGLFLLMILVIIHELGHAWAAVRNGVKVEEFGLGFPPRAKILGKYKGTLITLNWLLPLGGFCQMKGESDDAKEKGSYGAASFWGKTKILFAGVLMNLIAAMIIFTILAWIGLPKIFPNQFALVGDNDGQHGTVEIAGVVEGSPAEKAGLKKGDLITSVANTEVEFSTQVPDLTKSNAGEEISIEYKRDVELRTTSTVLNKDNTAQGYLGIQTQQKDFATIKATWSAPLVGVIDTFQFIGATFAGLGDMLGNLFGGLWGLMTGGGEAAQQRINIAGESVAGPVSILGVIFPNALAAGPVTLLWIMGVISLTLTVMNILPIPGLDGGRWYLTAGFKLFKKKLTKEREGLINGIGMMILYGLIIIITISDIWKMF
ncbi:M50 family metallopeptidase [Candidatus Saccharibacteria bacterium]|nr:M50 family metallopeptidase [Candidatus Saccharibacteria bacterium]